VDTLNKTGPIGVQERSLPHGCTGWGTYYSGCDRNVQLDIPPAFKHIRGWHGQSERYASFGESSVACCWPCHSLWQVLDPIPTEDLQFRDVDKLRDETRGRMLKCLRDISWKDVDGEEM
jgi:hypothetical protein